MGSAGCDAPINFRQIMGLATYVRLPERNKRRLEDRANLVEVLPARTRLVGGRGAAGRNSSGDDAEFSNGVTQLLPLAFS